MVKFHYRTLKPSELIAKQLNCVHLKANRMTCRVHAKMHVVINDETIIQKFDLCMAHFIQQFTFYKDDPNIELLNLDDFATAQELHIHNSKLKAKEVKSN